MKAEKFILHTEFIRSNAIARISHVQCDGKTMVSISNAGSRTVKQNALLWMWHTEVSCSGKGSYDTKESVHRSVKLRWVIPILIRDDPVFSELYGMWKQSYGSDVDRMNWFADNQVSTATLSTHQLAEVLTDYQRYYTDHGVNLTNPEDLKLLYYQGK